MCHEIHKDVELSLRKGYKNPALEESDQFTFSHAPEDTRTVHSFSSWLKLKPLQSEINEIVKKVMGGKSTSLSFHEIELGFNKMVLLRCLRLS